MGTQQLDQQSNSIGGAVLSDNQRHLEAVGGSSGLLAQFGRDPSQHQSDQLPDRPGGPAAAAPRSAPAASGSRAPGPRRARPPARRCGK